MARCPGRVLGSKKILVRTADPIEWFNSEKKLDEVSCSTNPAHWKEVFSADN